MTISTSNLKALPEIDTLCRALQSSAMLDAVLSPEWEHRYFSFSSFWAPGQKMGSMRNGCGDEVFAVFSDIGCFIKGFAHEYPMSPFARKDQRIWPGVIDEVPREFASSLHEPAFSPEATTFCIWRKTSDKEWKRGKIKFPNVSDPDGSEEFLRCFDARPATYKKWAEEYYEHEIDLASVKEVFEHRPLTKKLIAKLNPDLALEDLAAEAKEIGYPVDQTS